MTGALIGLTLACIAFVWTLRLNPADTVRQVGILCVAAFSACLVAAFYAASDGHPLRSFLALVAALLFGASALGHGAMEP